MNGVIITTALRQADATEALRLQLKFTPKPRKIILVHCVGKPEFDASWVKELADQNPEVEYIKTQPGSSLGLTGAWNLGFIRARMHHCDAIVCVNDDVYVNNTWPNIFETIRAYPKAMVGPVSKKPGVDYTRVQRQDSAVNQLWFFDKPQHALKQDGSESKAPYLCVNGFCFGLHDSLCLDLINTYGEVLDAENWPWGGQEEDLGQRISMMGGQIVVDGRTYVDHVKFSDWRRLGCTNAEFNK